jgi:predicted AlkP superfamily phosphohydrolase/phosphomutase
VGPGRHGFHRLTQIEPGTYNLVARLPGEFIETEPFWVRLSREGCRVAVLDVPLSGLSEGLNGIQMVEWGSHDAAYGFWTWPPTLRDEVLERFGVHPAPSPCDAIDRSPEGFRRFKEQLLAGVKAKCDLTLEYLAADDWDFFIQVFTEAHCAGHQAWHLHHATHPDHDAAVSSAAGDPLREVYVAIDQAIGDILTRLGDDTTVFLLGTHGMAHNIGADFLLEEVLVRLGGLVRASTRGEAGGEGLRGLARSVWVRLPEPARRGVRPLLAPLRRPAAGPRPLSARFDMTRSTCFPHENGHLVSGIRINLRGREPLGIVEPGGDMDRLCAALAADLLEVTDAAGGRPLVARVLRSSELFSGNRLDHLPDLLVVWSDEVRVGSRALHAGGSCRLAVRSPKIGVVEGEYRYGRTGDHRPEGLLVTVGPGIRPGRLDRAVSLLDLAPTFLALFGLAADDLDGRPVEELLRRAPGPDVRLPDRGFR